MVIKMADITVLNEKLQYENSELQMTLDSVAKQSQVGHEEKELLRVKFFST
jgi:hypothetical protein